MGGCGFSSISLLLLLIVVAVASEPETFTKNQGNQIFATASRYDYNNDILAGRSEQDASLRAAPTRQSPPVSSTSRMNTSTPTDIISEDVRAREQSSRSSEEKQDNEQEKSEENEEEDYDGEDEDEYEEELKAVAESHEAMSKDDTRNSNVSSLAPLAVVIGERSPAAKSFDSHEVTVVNASDEDVASNEAITDEVVDKYDEEVAELLKYKKARNSNLHGEDKKKTKRVPTVKKELSTQKEILVGGSNETQVPKSLLPSEETLNRLIEETESVRRRNAAKNGLTKNERTYPERLTGESEIGLDNRYSETELENPKKLDKRQEMEEVEDELEEMDDLSKKLLKLLMEVSLGLRRWQRLQGSLIKAENEHDFVKRDYQTTTSIGRAAGTPSTASDVSWKSRKKLKKKKRKSKHRFSSTMMTPTAATPPLLTTTETPWQTTPVQWHLIAERLFGPPWQQDLQDNPEKEAKVRYSVASKPRILPSIRELIEQNKSKSNSKAFSIDRKPPLSDNSRELGGERLFRFGKVNTHQPAHGQGNREFTNVYDRPADPGHPADYETAENYQRLRYNQPSSRDYLRRQEDDYQNDFGTQEANFAHNHEYEPPGREFAISKSWPDISNQYGRAWKMEERPSVPIPAPKWPWMQPQSDSKFWPQRGKFLQPERNYWSPSQNEEDSEEAEKTWQQQQQQQQQQRLPSRSWEGGRSSGWPVEKFLKIPATWQQTERSMKLYDRDQSSNAWKNRSELSKSSTKHEAAKLVLPQITMKTWNSLTSDPATWPYKFPGAKPWPKDENGKSYNPNADLVKKLGLDKQNDPAWSKGEAQKLKKLKEERRTKMEKQNRIPLSNEPLKEHEFPRTDASKYKSSDERSNLSDYKARSNESMKPSWSNMLPEKGTKEWIKSREPENLQSDDAYGRNYESMKNSWSNEDSMPKIQSVSAWVMAADQSTWKPYQIKPMEAVEDNSSRRWSNSRSNEQKWTKKEGSWSGKMNDSWMERSNLGSWSEKPSLPGSWPGKSVKLNSWLPKAMEEGDSWTSRPRNIDSWRVKGDPSWLNKPDEPPSWSSKINSWSAKENSAPSSIKSNESWTSKGNDISKYGNGDSWRGKIKDEDSWTKSNDASWKTNESNSWQRKQTEQAAWSAKSNDLGSWQQKMSDEWNFGKSSSSGTWPAKWKQFAYHRVTAMPISKPGTTADAAASKSKNAFVAVSAVSSPKYSANEWRKNDEETHNENLRSEDQERSTGQFQVGLELPIYAWKKDSSIGATTTTPTKGNGTDPLENQLEALRQIDIWPYKENEPEKGSTSTTMQTTSIAPTNSTTMQAHPRTESAAKESHVLLERNRQTISMK